MHQRVSSYTMTKRSAQQWAALFTWQIHRRKLRAISKGSYFCVGMQEHRDGLILTHVSPDHGKDPWEHLHAHQHSTLSGVTVPLGQEKCCWVSAVGLAEGCSAPQGGGQPIVHAKQSLKEPGAASPPPLPSARHHRYQLRPRRMFPSLTRQFPSITALVGSFSRQQPDPCQ